MTQLNFSVTQNNFWFEPSNFPVAEWMLIFFQFKEEFSDFGITFVRFRGWDLFSTQQHYLACWVLDSNSSHQPPHARARNQTEIGKSNPKTGKFFVQPEKVILKPEISSFNQKNHERGIKTGKRNPETEKFLVQLEKTMNRKPISKKVITKLENSSFNRKKP